MGKSAKCQIFSHFLYVALVLVPCLVLNYCFLGFGLFAFIVTVLLLLLSSIFSKKLLHSSYVDEKVIQDENYPTCDDSTRRKFLENEPEEEMEDALESEVGFVHEPEEFPSDSGSINDDDDEEEEEEDDVSSENFELDWMRYNSKSQNGVISSDSIVSEDDEDSLIEIAIPEGSDDQSICGYLSEEEPKQKMKSNDLADDDFLPESFMRQQGLMEIFEDVNEVNNEEESLIEIDISVGSIKCSKFEIQI